MIDRSCLTCGIEVTNCTSFTLARDIIKFHNGEQLDFIREFCGTCDMTGKMKNGLRIIQ